LIGICEAKKGFLRYRKVKKYTAHYSGLLVVKRRKKGIKYQVTHLVWILLQIGIFIWKKAKSEPNIKKKFLVFIPDYAYEHFVGHTSEYPEIR